MKAQTLSAFLALAASLQQVSAGWSDSPSYKCPQNSCDKCTTQQSSGFDWSDLAVGEFSFYGGFEFEGFSCSNSFGKRDLLTGRNFGSKCISGSASSEPEKCPKASCQDIPSFSIDTLEISVEFDVELEFQYGMDDGSTCKQKCSCSAEGSSIKNTQCGGAKNVTVVLPSPPPSKPTCSVGIHSIGFNCPSSCSSTSTATSTVISYTTPTVVSTTSSVMTTSFSTTASTTSTSIPVISTSTSAASSSTLTTAASSSTTSTSATSSSIATSVASSTSSPASSSSSSSLSSSVISSSSVSTSAASSSAASSSILSSSAASSSIASSSAFVSNYTSVSSAASSSATSPITTSIPAQSITTVIVDTTVTTCPVTNIHTTGGTTSTEITQTVSTITSTRTSTICTQCQASAIVSSTTGVSSAQPSVACPSVLPSCLNTWMNIITDCSVDDYNCFCPSSNLTSMVFQCLSAHGASDNEVSAAQVYFQGLCAEYVTQNPAIITAASTLTATATIAGPVTTINVYTTLVVPCTQSNGPASTTTIISSAVIVPQVVLTTVTGSSVGLVQGTPTPAATTAAAAGLIPTTMATVAPTQGAQGTQGAAGSTGTITASPAKFTGSASRSNVAYGIIGAAFAFSFFAM